MRHGRLTGTDSAGSNAACNVGTVSKIRSFSRNNLPHAWLPYTPVARLPFLRAMKQRGGSCTSSGTITLNPALIRASRSCIDYVITHELCHLRHPNHSQAFYDLLTAVISDWQERKLRLERMLA